MRYAQSITWKAIGEIVENWEEAHKSAHFQLPEALKEAAVEFFLKYDASSMPPSTDHQYAMHIVRTALMEIKEKGRLDFGIVDKYWA